MLPIASINIVAPIANFRRRYLSSRSRRVSEEIDGDVTEGKKCRIQAESSSIGLTPQPVHFSNVTYGHGHYGKKSAQCDGDEMAKGCHEDGNGECHI